MGNCNPSAGGLSTNGANRKIGRPGGVALCDKTNQTVGVRGALFGYFLGKQKVTKKPNIIIRLANASRCIQ